MPSSASTARRTPTPIDSRTGRRRPSATMARRSTMCGLRAAAPASARADLYITLTRRIAPHTRQGGTGDFPSVLYSILRVKSTGRDNYTIDQVNEKLDELAAVRGEQCVTRTALTDLLCLESLTPSSLAMLLPWEPQESRCSRHEGIRAQPQPRVATVRLERSLCA
jgi:hypothetical protein